jgi:SAM-dependent methyltransferase
MNYQYNYSSHFPAARDLATRQRKAAKIMQALTTQLQRDDLRGMMCLDIGCSIGIISKTLAAAGACVFGVDIDAAALQMAVSTHTRQATFVLGDGCATPFPDETFDVLICSQVYEHSPSLALLAGEIHRVLKIGGLCFFSGPNRWAVMEEHYHLPFLSWFPKVWANRYVRWSGRAAEYYECPRSAGELQRALARFVIRDLTPEMLRHPERYAMEPEVGKFKYLAQLVPDWLWIMLGRIIPNFNWMLIKVEP